MRTVEDTPAEQPAPLPVWHSFGQTFVVLYRNLPATLMVIAPILIFWLPLALVPAWRVPGDTLSNQIVFGMLSTLGTATSLLAGMALQQATLRYLQDGTFPVDTAYRQSFGRLLPFLRVVAPVVLISTIAAGLLVVPFLIVFPMICLAPTVWLAERCGVFESFRRSAELSRGNRWRLLGITAIAVIPLTAVNLAIGMPGTMTGALQIAGGQAAVELASLATTMVTTILFAITYTALAACPTTGQSGLKSSATPLMQ